MAGSRKKTRRGGNSARTTQNSATGTRRNGVEQNIAVETEEELETAAVTPPPARKRMSLRRKIVLGILGFIVLLIGGSALWIYISLQRSLPTLSGTVRLTGISSPVTVTRDLYGVPHIVADTIEDAYTAQGYIHAQDRLFQMYLLRAAGQGRLAELLRPDDALIFNDIYFRTIGFRRAAEAELAQMSPQGRGYLEAYARGVNAFISSHRDNLPFEFTLGQVFLGGLLLEEWQPVDSIQFGKLQAWDLTDSWEDDVVRSDLIAKVGEERANQLLPGTSGTTNATTGYVPALDTLTMLNNYKEEIQTVLPNMGLSDLGSNSWALSGSKTTSGKPMLSNDPHLGVRNPSVWYQVHLSTKDGQMDVVGFGFAGAPGVVTGHNRDIAWGVTNTGGDVQDVYIEKLDPVGHPGQYLSGDKWVPLEIITETIKIKDGEPRQHAIRFTNHGPILDDIAAALISGPISPTQRISRSITDVVTLKWTGYEPGRLLEGVFALQTASNWEEFRAALENWDLPGQNFIYADRAGNIGYQMTGRYPTRKSGDGSTMVPGWTDEHEWTGLTEFKDLPNIYNPAEGFVATANNRPEGAEDIAGHWSYPWRIDRIRELLKAKDKHSMEDMEAVLKDTKSTVAAKWAPILAGLKPTDPKEQAVVDLFKGWDGDLRPESGAAAAYQVIARSALTETFSDELGDDQFLRYVGSSNAAIRALELLLETPDDPLWDRVDTPQKETRDDTLRRALTGALIDLNSAMGDNPSEWQWGKIHQIWMVHPVFRSVPVVNGLLNLEPGGIGGDGTTVSVAGFPLFRTFTLTLHQSYRMIIDVADWNNSRAIFASGQSGQPSARHWGDMYPKWLSYQYNPLLYAPERVQQQLGAVLVLQP